MNTAAQRDARRAVWMIFGLFTIPFLSVTSVALLADIASTTNPTAALIGIPATLLGVAAGVAILRLAAMMRSGAVAICAALLAAVDRGEAVAAQALVIQRPTAALQPALVLTPSATGRRGPPRVRNI